MKTQQKASWEDLNIRCRGCGVWGQYPVEWLNLGPQDRAYLEDGHRCQACWEKEEDERYYRQGVGELLGY